MATDTTNYLLKKPTVGGDDDLWGGYINDNMDTIDTQMKSNDDAAATAQSTADAALPKAGGTMTGDTAHGDNVKAKFGTSDDLQIYHDGSSSRIVDAGTGSLKIQAEDFAVNNVGDTENMITAEPNGNVTLFYDGGVKLATTSTGVDVTGTVTADGVVVQDPTTLGAEIKGLVNAIPSAQVMGYIATGNSTMGVAGDLLIAPRTSAAANIRFVTGTTPTERARIDSSGNLLVGTTSTTGFGSTTGAQLRSNGGILATVSGDQALALSRTTSDGAIAEFYKDGTTVGSIGTHNGDMVVGTGDVGLKFNDANNGIVGWNTSTNNYTTNTIDLGATDDTFKDLYLGGGVYLGGTGAANKLDDYETGTWTPAVSGVTLTTTVGRYTKIGRMVYAQFEINSDAATSSAQFLITGLPFANADASNIGRGAGYLSYDPSSDWHGLLFNNNSNSEVAFRRHNGGALESITYMSGKLLWGTLVYYVA